MLPKSVLSICHHVSLGTEKYSWGLVAGHCMRERINMSGLLAPLPACGVDVWG